MKCNMFFKNCGKLWNKSTIEICCYCSCWGRMSDGNTCLRFRDSWSPITTGTGASDTNWQSKLHYASRLVCPVRNTASSTSASRLEALTHPMRAYSIDHTFVCQSVCPWLFCLHVNCQCIPCPLPLKTFPGTCKRNFPSNRSCAIIQTNSKCQGCIHWLKKSPRKKHALKST